MAISLRYSNAGFGKHRRFRRRFFSVSRCSITVPGADARSGCGYHRRSLDGIGGDGVARSAAADATGVIFSLVMPAGMSARCGLTHRPFDQFRHGQGRTGGAGRFRQTVSDLRMPRHDNEIPARNRPYSVGYSLIPVCPQCQRRGAGASADSARRCEYS